MIILNEIMDTMSQEKRAILLNRIAFRQKARSSVDAITPKIVPKITEIIKEGIVIHNVHNKGLKKKSGILEKPLFVE